VDVDELVWLDATSLAGLIRAGDVTAVEVVQAHLDRLERVGERVNAFVTVLGEQALDAARRPATGPLAGVPFTVKDSFATAGVRTTRGSLLFADHVPVRDATAVARLRGAGAVLLGKTSLPEMSYWTETDNRLIGRTSNPYDPERTPGGSSGGESAAIKPTHGRVPYTGHYPDALRRWWHVGPMARSVRDLRLALTLLEGPDGHDPYAVALPAGKPSGLVRVGWTTAAFGPVDPDVASAVASAAEALADLGLDVQQVALPDIAQRDHTATSATLFTAEVVPYLRAQTAGREAELSPVIARTLRAPDVALADYLVAEREVEQLRSAFAQWFQTHDLLLCPVVTIPAPHQRRAATVVRVWMRPHWVRGRPAALLRRACPPPPRRHAPARRVLERGLAAGTDQALRGRDLAPRIPHGHLHPPRARAPRVRGAPLGHPPQRPRRRPRPGPGPDPIALTARSESPHPIGESLRSATTVHSSNPRLAFLRRRVNTMLDTYRAGFRPPRSGR